MAKVMSDESKPNPPRKSRRAATRKSAPRAGKPALAVAESGPRFYYKGNRIKQLRAFCTIAKLGTLARAADALFLSQPSISLQLTSLERELGVALIERRRRRVAMTREGQLLYDLAQPLVDGIDGIDEAFRAQTSELGARELNIACGNSTITMVALAIKAADALQAQVRKA